METIQWVTVLALALAVVGLALTLWKVCHECQRISCATSQAASDAIGQAASVAESLGKAVSSTHEVMKSEHDYNQRLVKNVLEETLKEHRHMIGLLADEKMETGTVNRMGNGSPS